MGIETGRWLHALGAAAVAALISVAAAPSTSAAETCTQQIAASTSAAHSPSRLEMLRRDCPLLGRIVEEFALADLGEAQPAGGFDSRTRAIVVAATAAATGDNDSIERYARSAVESGASKSELKELLYLTALYAGVPKAVEATRALSDLLGQDARAAW